MRPLDRELINFAQTSSPTSGAGAGHFATGRIFKLFANTSDILDIEKQVYSSVTALSPIVR